MALSITLYAGGKTKGSLWDPLIKDYLKRITLWSLDIVDVDSWEKHLKKIEKLKKPLLLLDSGGQDMSSEEFSKTLKTWMMQNTLPLFCIGSFDGFPACVQKKASQRLRLGSMTWCHQMARLMFVEQIYRSQQLLLNHPYALV